MNTENGTEVRRAAAALVLIAALAGGCGGQRVEEAPAVVDDRTITPATPIDGITPENNSARAAAMLVATMPPVGNRATEREILLHVGLYRAAHAANVGDFTTRFVLEPCEDGEVRALPIQLREFRLRILAGLVDLDGQVAWTRPDPSPEPAAVYFPGTRELATRLRIRIENRGDTEIRGELADFTGHVGSSRQEFVAEWDDGEWVVEREGPKLVW